MDMDQLLHYQKKLAYEIDSVGCLCGPAKQ